jgi:hypothetical protein
MEIRSGTGKSSQFMEWPRPNEKLIRSDVDWQHNACVDCNTPTLGSFARKFKEAADVLVKEAAAGNAILDSVVIPIMFLYRQYLELSIKQIVMFGREVVGRGKGYPTYEHDLSCFGHICPVFCAERGDDRHQFDVVRIADQS